MASGRYQNASEVMRAGLRLLHREEAKDVAKVAALREAVEKGWTDLASGRYDDISDDTPDDFIGELSIRAAQARSAG